MLGLGDDGGGADGARLRCNGCWADCTSAEFSCATACQHLYCLSCCQTILESDDPTCPICSQLVQKSNVKAVRVLSSIAELPLVLAGQAPRVALEATHAGIQFYNTQQALYAEYAAQQSQRKIARTQEQCRKKLQEVHEGYKQAKRKFEEVLAQKHALAQDNAELQQKYNQKAMQDKKLKEGVALLQAENEHLRRQLAALQGGGGGGGAAAMGPGLAAMGLPNGAGRASRAGMLGMDAGLGRRPGTAAGIRPGQVAQPPPDPSPLSSVRLGPGSGGGYGYDTPANQPVPMRQMHTSGGAGAGVRHLSGGLGMGGAGGGLGMGGAGGLGLPGAGMGGRQSAQNDKRASLGLAYQQPAGWGPSASL